MKMLFPNKKENSFYDPELKRNLSKLEMLTDLTLKKKQDVQQRSERIKTKVHAKDHDWHDSSLITIMGFNF